MCDTHIVQNAYKAEAKRVRDKATERAARGEIA